jgi:hypothetical protein
MPEAIVRDVERRCRSGKLKAWERRIRDQKKLNCHQLGEAVAAMIENARKSSDVNSALKLVPTADQPAQGDDLVLVERQLTVRKTQEEKQLAFASVYEPNDVDTHGEFMTADEIEKLAHKFMLKMLNNKIDVMHDNKPGRAHVVESFIAREGDLDFTPKSWVLGLKIFDEQLWEDIKNGEMTGLSFEALVRKIPVTVEMQDKARIEGRTSAIKGHSHKFSVTLNEKGNVVSGSTAEVDGHSHRITENNRTEITNGHRHVFSITVKVDTA